MVEIEKDGINLIHIVDVEDTLSTLIVICISRRRNHSLTYRKKNCQRGRSRPRQHNLEDVKDFAAKVYTTFFVQPKICNYVVHIKRTSKFTSLSINTY
jgi:hypothetical protein